MEEPSARPSTASELVRQRVENGGERFWRLSDFRDLSFLAVAQALSRLARAGGLRRVSRGLYWRSRQTSFGESLPSPVQLQTLARAKAPVFPAGLAAANLLGFTTQNPQAAEVATTAASLPRALIGTKTVVYARRPAAWGTLSSEDAALLDFLRQAGRTSELSPEATMGRTRTLLAADGRLGRLTTAAASEPPRVRALLGALAEAAGADASTLTQLRLSLNPLSRFDFGLFAGLPTAHSWQARTSGAA